MPAAAVLSRRRALSGLALLATSGCGRRSAATAPVGDDFSLGSPTAKATVVETASVGCPVCGRWAREVFPAFKAKWIETGRVRYTYREMLVGGGVELTAASAGFVLARCVGRDKYWPVIEAIYAGQERLFQAPRETLLGVAHAAGLDDKAFDACMSDDAAFAALSRRSEANSRRDGGVDATPTFVVNGRKLPAGFQSLAEIEKALAAG